ncbi:phosphoribosylaminoimidazole carboxylase ATPase subunit [Klebsiella pneumoniae]|uniref:Phosphoribosylaminoimidazole carboxylase ATPase subunit n=1 Tax=Klebsiella pneumoniae TaxID=573 RepID=A0A2X1QIN8_KLEPN|nr:phosphoribosylaminoimidazole carboxylase ATPase subunit [Klebsiella pneumoniae]
MKCWIIGSAGCGMKQVCVLGNGQLGRMLRQAGEPLGIAVWPVGLEADPEAGAVPAERHHGRN